MVIKFKSKVYKIANCRNADSADSAAIRDSKIYSWELSNINKPSEINKQKCKCIDTNEESGCGKRMKIF